MVITRKIEVIVNEEDKELRKQHYEKLFDNRRIAMEVANMAVSHLFALDHSMPYLSQEDKETITYLGVKGKAGSYKNVPYVAASETFKGKADMGMVSCILQNVQKMYYEDRKRGMWQRSLRSYKENMPIPFQVKRFSNFTFVDSVGSNEKTYHDCVFSLMGIPFKMVFGKDRSGNRLIVERILAQKLHDETSGQHGTETGYKMRTSSLQFVTKEDEGTKKQKIFLLLCVDIPKKKVKLDPKKTLFSFLGVYNPIICTTNKAVADKYMEYLHQLHQNDCVEIPEDLRNHTRRDKTDTWSIGTKDEFNHRRRQIQEAVRRCQIYNKFTNGGKGRKRKCKALEHWHNVEYNYINTKLHIYSKELVKLAVDHECGSIKLLDQKRRENQAKKENTHGLPFVLRNWSYYGLKEKVKYKSQFFDIKFFSDKEELTSEEDGIESVTLEE